VLESLAGDIGACEDGLQMGYLEDPAAENWAAFRLRSEDGQIWLAQFAMGFVPDDLLRTGEMVGACALSRARLSAGASWGAPSSR
jgi:hypothetical protein